MCFLTSVALQLLGAELGGQAAGDSRPGCDRRRKEWAQRPFRRGRTAGWGSPVGAGREGGEGWGAGWVRCRGRWREHSGRCAAEGAGRALLCTPRSAAQRLHAAASLHPQQLA